MKRKSQNPKRNEIFKNISDFKQNYINFKKNLLRINLIRNQLNSISSEQHEESKNNVINTSLSKVNLNNESIKSVKQNNFTNLSSNISKNLYLNSTIFENKLGSSFDNSLWAGFHKKNIIERQRYIQKIFPDIDINLLKTGGLSLLRADSIIENCIGIVSLPVGLATNFLINSKKFSIPMAVEEPSVIAAVSTAAKLIAENNGFFCYTDPPFMIGQIHICDFTGDEKIEAIKKINLNKENLIKKANGFCQHMVQRGGGVRQISARALPQHHSIKTEFICVDFIVDVCDSMGANTINTVAEGLANYLEELLICKGKVILKILSNLAVYRKATSEFRINLKNLGYKGIKGELLADRIIKAYEISFLDSFRAATHNKGIMNGVDAVALALGQDWRAIEAGAHTYAAINSDTFAYDRYKPLTYYKIIEIKNEKYLYGSLTLPMAIGTVGGSINSNPNYSNMFKLLGNPNTQQLACIMVSVGLGQNFAALRALVSEGIQKGHMGLQSRNVAIRAGVPDFLVADVSNFMKNNNSINETAAKKYLESLNLLREIRNKNNVSEPIENLSSLYIELDYSFLKEPIIMNVLLNTNIEPPIHFSLRSNKIGNQDNRVNDIFKNLFGASKNEDWLHEFIKFITNFNVSSGTIHKSLTELASIKYKIKMALILFFIVSYNLLKINFETTKNFLEKLLSRKYNYSELIQATNNESFTVNFGLSLLFECFEIFTFYFENYLNLENKQIIRNKLYEEIEKSIKNYIYIHDFIKNLLSDSTKTKTQRFEEFFNLRCKRLNATILILIDIGFSEEKVDQLFFDSCFALGRYIEIKVTLLRDFTRFKIDPTENFNAFRIFKCLFGTEYENNNGNANDYESSLVKEYFRFRLEEREELLKSISGILQMNSDLSKNIRDLESSIEKYYKFEDVKTDIKQVNNKINPKF